MMNIIILKQIWVDVKETRGKLCQDDESPHDVSVLREGGGVDSTMRVSTVIWAQCVHNVY